MILSKKLLYIEVSRTTVPVVTPLEMPDMVTPRPTYGVIVPYTHGWLPELSKIWFDVLLYWIQAESEVAPSDETVREPIGLDKSGW